MRVSKMYALANIDANGIDFINDKIRKYFYERIENGEAITLHLDLKYQHDGNRYYSTYDVQRKMVVRNTNYAILYSRLLAFISYTDNFGYLEIYPKNTSKREQKNIEFIHRLIKKKKELKKIAKDVVGLPHIFINGEYGQYLLIMDKSRFNPLMCDCRAFLVDENRIADDFLQVFGEVHAKTRKRD